MRKFLEMTAFGLCIASIDTLLGALITRNGTVLAITFVVVFVLACVFYAMCQVSGDRDG